MGHKNMFAIFAALGALLAQLGAISARAAGPYPSMVLKNNFGEQTTNYILPGGSSGLGVSFVVDSTNANGLGVSSATFNGVGTPKIYMHTSQTPAVGNPNPAAGYLMVQLPKAYTAFVSSAAAIIGPQSGTPINVTSGVTAGLGYVITSVGTTSLSQWQSIGLKAGITPAVGVAFIASASTTATGTGVVQVPAALGSAVSNFELIGSPSLSAAATGGAWLLGRFFGSGGALTMNAYTPAGSITMNSYTPAGTNDSGTPPLFTGTPATLTGTFAGTPATLTGTIAGSQAIKAPTDGSTVYLRFSMQ